MSHRGQQHICSHCVYCPIHLFRHIQFGWCCKSNFTFVSRSVCVCVALACIAYSYDVGQMIVAVIVISGYFTYFIYVFYILCIINGE